VRDFLHARKREKNGDSQSLLFEKSQTKYSAGSQEKNLEHHTPQANMSKRAHDDVQHIPEGFKVIGDDTPKIVFDDYHKFELSKVPLAGVWFDSMDDDKEEVKVKLYVKLDDLCQEDIDVIQKVDASIAETAKLMNRQHSKLVGKNGQVKLTAYLKLQKRRKQSLNNGDYLVTAKFTLSSVYDYKDWYGINLIISRSDKKPTFSQVPKPKAKEEEDDQEDKE
tara:strand:+ start:3206 stop:3871 length:666 start_codon:yes stop_codon:yes gene_type:complete